MKRILFISWGLMLGALASALATPKNVIIIRHAEKIQGGIRLNLQGLERTGALPYYFSGTPLYNNPAPTHVFATALDKPDSPVRTIQTCTPIANHYNVPLNIDFKHTETKEIAEEIPYPIGISDVSNPSLVTTTLLLSTENVFTMSSLTVSRGTIILFALNIPCFSTFLYPSLFSA